MEPEKLSLWVPIFKDLAMYALAIFVAIFSITTITEPTLLGIALGFAVTLFGVPAARRWDGSRRKNGNGNGE